MCLITPLVLSNVLVEQLNTQTPSFLLRLFKVVISVTSDHFCFFDAIVLTGTLGSND